MEKKLIGALIAGALAIAVYHGPIDQRQADNIKTQADQTLGTGPNGQQQPAQPTQPAPAPPQAPTPQPAPAPQNTAPTAPH